jgi:hypothetical protein
VKGGPSAGGGALPASLFELQASLFELRRDKTPGQDDRTSRLKLEAIGIRISECGIRNEGMKSEKRRLGR